MSGAFRCAETGSHRIGAFQSGADLAVSSATIKAASPEIGARGGVLKGCRKRGRAPISMAAKPADQTKKVNAKLEERAASQRPKEVDD